MKFYSEYTQKNYNTAEECLAAEKLYKEEQAKAKVEQEKYSATRKARAAEVDSAYQTLIKAEKAYMELRTKFIKDYGSYHMSFNNKDLHPVSFSALVNPLFDLLQ